MSDLDRQATSADHDDGEWAGAPYCKKCGNGMDWADCWQIDCEEGVYDAYEEDCINNDPGTWMTCETCEGKGGWWYCPNPACSAAGKPHE